MRVQFLTCPRCGKDLYLEQEQRVVSVMGFALLDGERSIGYIASDSVTGVESESLVCRSCDFVYKEDSADEEISSKFLKDFPDNIYDE